MKAKDLMVPLQEYLKPDNTLKEAANLLRIAQRGEEKIGVKALPVLDESRKTRRNSLHRRYSQGGTSCLYGS